MSARKYRVCSEWRLDEDENKPFTWYSYDTDTNHFIAVQVADVKQDGDTHVWHNGAYRIITGIVDTANGGITDVAPYKRGKGGTVPWVGESAWAHAAREYRDVVFEARRNAY